MNSKPCPECGNAVSQSMTTCTACGHPLVQSPSRSERWPIFQYGLIAFAVPFSLSGVSMALRMQGIGISHEVMGLGIVFGALTAACLFVAAFVDRTYFNRGKPAGSIKVISWFTVIVLLLAIIWLLLAVVAEQAGFKLE